MCGILAVASRSGSVSSERLAAGISAIAHRGPDSEGSLVRSLYGVDVALAHRRLSIFDLSSSGAQPMIAQGGQSIIFNGSIFNWPELRTELKAHGYRFNTETDTEVILAAYDKWGPDCVTQFNGFWAFVLLDEGAHGMGPTLFVSRDRFGIKPLYYSSNSQSTIFASEIGSILAYREENPRIDLPELARQIVLQLGDDSDRTIYDGIRELEPATNAVLHLNTGEMRRWRYWAPSATPSFEGTEKEALDRFTELFEDLVRIRLRADREVALTLSGGIDSSAIAVAISRVSDIKVRAFTSHFPGMENVDETAFAKIVADKLSLDHVLVQPDIANLTQNERELTRHQELMYGSFSLLVNWYVIREIQKTGVRIFLTGQGGDELFLGYERYYAPYLRQLLQNSPASFPRELIQIGRNSRLGVGGALKFLLYFSDDRIRLRRYLRDAANVYSDKVMTAVKGRPSPLPNSLFNLQRQEICGQQLRHLLRYDDRTAAAFGTEGRPAFLDHRLAEFAISLPWQQKIRQGWTKHVIRRYLEKAGLPEIAWRKHKFGYAAPTPDWTRRLAGGVDFAAPAAKALLKSGLQFDAIPKRMQFPVYNLLSTSQEMHWVI